MMKKLSTLILCVGVSLSVAAQKKELKTADKLMSKSGDFAGAAAELAKAKDLVVDTKFQTQYYYLMGVQAFGDENTHDYVSAYEYFLKTLKEEKKTGNKKYAKDTKAYLQSIKKNLYKSSNAFIKQQKYKEAGDVVETLRAIEPSNKSTLNLLSNCRIQSKEYDKAIVNVENYVELLGDTVYNALDIYSGSFSSFFDAKGRDAGVSAGAYTYLSDKDDITIISDSIVEQSYRELVALYTQQGYSDKKEVLLKKAIKKFPENVFFMDHYAEIVYKSGDHESYLKVLEDNLKISPDSKELWFNLGVTAMQLGDFEKSSMAYEKAIEIDPNYRNAYINKGLMMMREEQKMVEELNAAQGTKKYIVIKREIEGLYKDAATYFEKAYEIEKSDDLKTMLTQIYNTIGEKAKVKAL